MTLIKKPTLQLAFSLLFPLETQKDNPGPFRGFEFLAENPPGL
jgi:hypothetical protein